MGERGLDGFGTITWWGFSPAVDLQETGIAELMKKLDFYKSPDTVQILVIGAGDLRHVLTTIARRHRHTKRKLHFFVIETALELYARHMLFLSLGLEMQKRMGLQEKTELFLELYGNTLVRKQTADYVSKMSTEFIKMVTDSDYLEKKLPCLDLAQLKFKERDFLEGIFKFWRDSKPEAYDPKKCWELRLRQHLRVRYDSRYNAYDWDHAMVLQDRGVSIIHIQEYKRWRETGEAFSVREGTYDVPNKTMASAMVLRHDGEKYARRGYWGDIVVSPYVPLGIESEERSFFKKSNNVHTKTAEDVAEFNVLAMFHELTLSERYSLPAGDPKTDDKSKQEQKDTGPKLQEITEEEEEEETEAGESSTEQGDNSTAASTEKPQRPLDLEYESLPLDDVKVTFLPLGCAEELHKRSKYQKAFDVVYFGNSLVHHLKPEFNALFADRCTVLIESALMMLEIKKEQVQQYVNKVSTMAQDAGCKELEKCDWEQDTVVKMYFER
ncbi:dynein axonemal assembly factor 3-like [Littorina saxatilis]|uniref:Dynein assembly factor 3, axonemal n=1 Tax=Littorina saxatilis TaxID=31220 RepID=A0AAN9B5P7_9CAEN